MSRWEDDSMWETLTGPDGKPKKSTEEAEQPIIKTVENIGKIPVPVKYLIGNDGKDGKP